MSPMAGIQEDGGSARGGPGARNGRAPRRGEPGKLGAAVTGRNVRVDRVTAAGAGAAGAAGGPDHGPPGVLEVLDEVEHGWRSSSTSCGTTPPTAVHTLEDIFRPPARPDGAWRGAGFAGGAERWFERVAWAGGAAARGRVGVEHRGRAGRGAGGPGRGRAAGAAPTAPAPSRRHAAVAAAFRAADRPTTPTSPTPRSIARRPARRERQAARRAPGAGRAGGRGRRRGEVIAAPDSAARRRGRGRRAARGVAGGRARRRGGAAGGRPARAHAHAAQRAPQRAHRPLLHRRLADRGARGAGPGIYAPPRGLVEVTPETQDTPVSEHLRIRDFLTHDQARVWPKYLVIDPRNVDKIELVLAELERRGIPARGVHVMSGFRTPQYNRAGGDARGRAGLSRHMYGDAADLWIDNDGDGVMDDLDRDGRHGVGDALVVCDAVERVERAHPELVGGCGYYPGNGAHGPFTHIDTRGYRARWVGSGDGG
jgi:uncharacterized protein YcbK (DUF882 family)